MKSIIKNILLSSTLLAISLHTAYAKEIYLTVNYNVVRSDTNPEPDMSLINEIYYGNWDPIPSPTILENSSIKATYKIVNENESSQVIYAVSDLCTPGAECPPEYRLYINLSSNPSCYAGGIAYGDGTRWQYHYTYSSELQDQNMSCTVNLTAKQMVEPPQYGFKEMQILPTMYIKHWESFQIDKVNYLLADMYDPYRLMFYDSKRPYLLRFDPEKFQFVDAAPGISPNECYTEVWGDGSWLMMDGVFWWKHFEIGDQHAVVMANNFSYERALNSDCKEQTHSTRSYIYWWNKPANKFDTSCGLACDHLLTESPVMIESYTVESAPYLAVAGNTSPGQNQSYIYKWNGTQFIKDPNQPNIQINRYDYIEAFKDNIGDTYVIFNPYIPNTLSPESLIYKADKNGTLHLHQSSNITPNYPIAPQGGGSSLIFSSIDRANNKQIYLIFSRDNWIYRWEFDEKLQKFVFKPYQQHAINGTHASYVVNGEQYLGTAKGTDGAYGYKWNAETQLLDNAYSHIIYIPNGEVTSVGSLTPFSVLDNKGNTHLLIALTSNGGFSPIVHWTTANKQDHVLFK